MKYKAVIFDLFGTLVENFSRAEYEKTLEEMTEVLGAPKDEFVQRWVSTFNQRSTGVFPGAGDCVRYICRELKVPATEAQVQRAGRIRLDYTLKNMKPRKGALEVLAALKSKEYKIGLISDCTPETPLVWQDTPFAPFFNVTRAPPRSVCGPSSSATPAKWPMPIPSTARNGPVKRLPTWEKSWHCWNSRD
jgi:putative hydrolase of the HAD superfamily